MTEWRDRQGLKIWQHLLVFLFAYALLISRRPDAVFHAQLYAEDGHVWFADAYNMGWYTALFGTWAGYLQTLPRLAAGLALLVPLASVPLLLNLLAFLFQALPINLLLVERSSGWGSLRYRAALAGIYLVLPNCAEVSDGITNSLWLLTVSTLIVLVAAVPRNIAWRVFDVLILLLCGLTGPFCIFLLPLAVFLAWKYRERWRWVPVGILSLACLIQSRALLFVDASVRSHTALGATPALAARILGGEVYLGTLIGANPISAWPGAGLSIFFGCVAIVGTVIIVLCFLEASLPMRIFLVFSAILFAGSLASPLEWGRPDLSIWQLLAQMPSLRYWFFPTLAFAWSLVACSQSRTAAIRITSVALLCIMSLGVLRDWRHPALEETHFAESVARFNTAPPGATVIIPVHPHGWNMKLIKHPQR